MSHTLVEKYLNDHFKKQKWEYIYPPKSPYTFSYINFKFFLFYSLVVLLLIKSIFFSCQIHNLKYMYKVY